MEEKVLGVGRAKAERHFGRGGGDMEEGDYIYVRQKKPLVRGKKYCPEGMPRGQRRVRAGKTGFISQNRKEKARRQGTAPGPLKLKAYRSKVSKKVARVRGA